jgi:hypothetical protein
MLVEDREGALVITLNRPHAKNAMTRTTPGKALAPSPRSGLPTGPAAES